MHGWSEGNCTLIKGAGAGVGLGDGVEGGVGLGDGVEGGVGASVAFGKSDEGIELGVGMSVGMGVGSVVELAGMYVVAEGVGVSVGTRVSEGGSSEEERTGVGSGPIVVLTEGEMVGSTDVALMLSEGEGEGDGVTKVVEMSGKTVKELGMMELAVGSSVGDRDADDDDGGGRHADACLISKYFR